MMNLKHFRLFAIFSVLLIGLIGAGAAYAVTSATFVFDFVTDPGDAADGPDFNVTGIGPIDDTGTSCDAVVMVMVDPTGNAVDVDSFCLSIVTGLGGSDGDYGSFGTGYVPVSSPITYALFDLTAADLAALSGYGDSDQEYFDYVVANAVCLQEQFLDETDLGIPTAPAYSLCGGGLTAAGCSLNIPSGSVVGEAPLGAQAFYAPGQATDFSINPGTYIVIGQDESGSYYKIVLACAYLWVPVESMQPSFQFPQNGAPLPTRVVS
jgi:hypothetical protein